MSALGQKRTFWGVEIDVRFTPKADIASFGTNLMEFLGNRHLFIGLIPGMSGNTPFSLALDQQISAYVVVHFRLVFQHFGRRQDHGYISEDQELHPERVLFKSVQ